MNETTVYIKPEDIDFACATHGALFVVEVEYEVGGSNNLLDYYINTVCITKDTDVIDIMELIEENSRLWDALETKVVAMVEDELRGAQERAYERMMEQEQEGER
jgi:hypothetical protein